LPKGVSFAAAESADLLGVDAATATGIVTFRSDESSEPLADLLAALRDGRLDAELVALPADATYLRVATQIAVAAVEDPFGGPVIDEGPQPVSPADVRLQASALVIDQNGLVYRAESAVLALDQVGDGLIVALAPSTGPGAAAVAALGAQLDGPLQLAGLGIELWLADDSVVTGTIGVSDVSAAAALAGPWASSTSTPSILGRPEDGPGAPSAHGRPGDPDLGHRRRADRSGSVLTSSWLEPGNLRAGHLPPA
jgi:hypothetical protein